MKQIVGLDNEIISKCFFPQVTVFISNFTEFHWTLEVYKNRSIGYSLVTSTPVDLSSPPYESLSRSFFSLLRFSPSTAPFSYMHTSPGTQFLVLCFSYNFYCRGIFSSHWQKTYLSPRRIIARHLSYRIFIWLCSFT